MAKNNPKHSTIISHSTLTCPSCGHRKKERMPTDACQWFYACESCKMVLKPLANDCCVFCSFGDVSCPPVQHKDADVSQ